MYRSVPARCLAGRWSCCLNRELVGREVSEIKHLPTCTSYGLTAIANPRYRQSSSASRFTAGASALKGAERVNGMPESSS